MFVSIITFPLIVASALAAEGDWTIGSRTLPAPVAGSEALDGLPNDLDIKVEINSKKIEGETK